jgi:quercetin dioxygenase-like cupin family protein
MPSESTIPPAQALALADLVAPTEQGIASRVLARTSGGNVTLFAFDAGQGLEEHTSPFDALVLVLDGALELTIGGAGVRAVPGRVVRMPGGVPHALAATEAARMLLVMLREPKP